MKQSCINFSSVGPPNATNALPENLFLSGLLSIGSAPAKDVFKFDLLQGAHVLCCGLLHGLLLESAPQDPMGTAAPPWAAGESLLWTLEQLLPFLPH